MKLRILAILSVLILLISCSEEVSKTDTRAFISGMTELGMEASQTDAIMALQDFELIAPDFIDIPTLKSVSGEGLKDISRGSIFAPNQMDTLYGTWEYIDMQGWVLMDSTTPADGFRFEWEYADTANQIHDAAITIDELQFYQGDSLPENIHMSLELDNEEILWAEFTATYSSPTTVTDMSLTFEVVNYYQLGAGISATVSIDEEPFDGTIQFWAIDYTNNSYRIDLTIEVNGDEGGNIVLEDSDEWRLDVDVSEVVETDSIFEKRDVDGEITHSGNHAAYIEGYVWIPDDGDEHQSEIIIVYPDGEEEDLYTMFQNPTKGDIYIRPW